MITGLIVFMCGPVFPAFGFVFAFETGNHNYQLKMHKWDYLTLNISPESCVLASLA